MRATSPITEEGTLRENCNSKIETFIEGAGRQQIGYAVKDLINKELFLVDFKVPGFDFGEIKNIV